MLKNILFDSSMIKLLEAVVGITFVWNKFVLNRYKTCNVSMSNTGKQQFTAKKSIYQLSDKECSVPDYIDLWRSVWTRLYKLMQASKANESTSECSKI